MKMTRLFLIVNLIFIFAYMADAATTSDSESYASATSSYSSSPAICPGKKKPAACRKNEEFSKCVQAVCRAQNCTQKYQPIVRTAVAKKSCKRGCVCKQGFLRDDNGKCISENKCKVCPAYEEYSNCTQGICRMLNCSQQGQPLNCTSEVAKSSCKKGCVCQSGYLRTTCGTCVPESQCYGDLVCKDNEIVSKCPNSGHGDYCPRSEKEAKLQKTSKTFSDSCGDPACICRLNSKRDDSGNCISTRDCPSFTCSGKNEEYNSCPPYCPTDDCSQATPTGKCPRIGRIGIVVECKPDCRCIPGYWRNNGVCVPYAQCPGKSETCPSNEEFSNCTISVCRAQNCTQRGQPIACPAIAEGSCQKGCVCVEGTLRNSDGNCVTEDQCPGKSNTCGMNEILTDCPRACSPNKCPTSLKAEQLLVQDCFETLQCRPSECRCRPNYRRDKSGKCIFIGKCPGICPTNEEFSNCTQALCRAQNCTQSGQAIACAAVEEGSCTSGCVCKEGTLRDTNGNCVPETQCKAGKSENCPSNEEFSNCTIGVCRAQNCTQRGQPLACPAIAEGSCQKGCVCVEGTLRNSDGNCVPEDQCPGSCGKNEVLKNCPSSCAPVSCPKSYKEEQDKLANCFETLQCRPSACRCRPNYRRDKSGKCIFIGKCPGICPTNEEFSNCTQALCRAQNCTQSGQAIACAAVEEGSCTSGCVCKEGTLRDTNGDCVPETQCKAGKSENCPSNEEFSNCTIGVCRAQNCTQRGQPLACPAIAEGSCQKGCVCVEGTLRNSDGNCVPEDQCPGSCGKNEVLKNCPSSCAPVSCPKSYKEEQEKLANCFETLQCRPSACRCRPNYRRDENGKCIYIGKCPGICPTNEEFSNCTQALCRAQNCTQSGQAIACAAVEEGSCTSGCVCKEGTLRDKNGNCVPEKQCKAPQQPQCNQNEVLSCVHECPPERTCRNRNIQVRCAEPTKKCESKCVCKPGLYKNDIGECISEKECDQCQAPNEFFSCGQECDNECSMLATQNRTNCPLVNIVCNPKCYCVNGYARNEKKECIAIEQCPKSITCNGPNEVYDNCKKTCTSDICSSITSRIKCSEASPCQPGCVCKSGFFRIKKDLPCGPVCDCPEMSGSPDCPKKGD